MKQKQEEKNSFLYKLLNFPFFYLLVQFLLYKKNSKSKIFKEYFGLNKNDSVLEIGCGPGINRKLLPSEKYIGIDINCSHINKALKKYPDENFLCTDAVDFRQESYKESDNILICHLLHHLNDENCKKLIDSIYQNIDKSQKVFLIDIVFKKNQNPIAKLLGKLDKGNYVRNDIDYLKLFDDSVFNKDIIHEDKLLRIPSNFVITKLTKK